MKIAILGTLNPAVTYHDWVMIFRRHFWKTCVTEINITDGDTTLNSYVRRYADNLSIIVSVYKTSNDRDITEARTRRNMALINDADMVVAFTTNAATVKVHSDVVTHSGSEGKRVLILNTDNPVILCRQ